MTKTKKAYLKSNVIEIGVGLALMIFIPLENYYSTTPNPKYISTLIFSFPLFIAIPTIYLIIDSIKLLKLTEKETVIRRVGLLDNILYWYLLPLLVPVLILFGSLAFANSSVLPVTLFIGTILFGYGAYAFNQRAKLKIISEHPNFF